MRHLLRVSVTTAVLTGFIVASGSVLTPQFGLLTPAQAAKGIRATTDLCFWEGLGWNEMQPAEQKAWAKLGWTAEMWEDESETVMPASEDKEWGELNQSEQRALMDLGYTADSWENFDSSSC
jgi:hypothetical protein